MTKLWGPLGWMALHSVSLIYPETPTPAEKAIAKRFLDLFNESITCVFCKTHFTNMYTIYKSTNPGFLDSRQEFALFAFRAHNTVNRRLDKPKPSTVSQCLQTLRNATQTTSLKQFRESYLSYLSNNWGKEFSSHSLMMRHCVNEMIKINNEYWNPRELKSIPELAEADVLTPIEKTNVRFTTFRNPMPIKIGFAGGKLKLGRS